jgi:arsenate reductase (thioredoxin)
MKNVLFFSTGESARPYLATAIFNSLRAPALVKAVCACHEADSAPPQVVEALKEIGIDGSDMKSQPLRPDEGAEINLVVTFSAGVVDNHLQGVRREDWTVPDPSGQTLEHVRRIREQISKKVWRLIAKEGWYRLQPVASLRFRPTPLGTLVPGAVVRAS